MYKTKPPPIAASMSSSLPSPPATPPPASTIPSRTYSDLAAQLDALLESYLTLLDTYTSLRAQLSNQFSSGFLSLAHANRNAASVLGAGRRFGQDGYDGRMKALRGVRIKCMRNGKGEVVDKTEGEQAQEADKQSDEKSKPGIHSGRTKGRLTHQKETDADDGNGNEDLQHKRRDDGEEYSTQEPERSKDSASSNEQRQSISAAAAIDAEHCQFTVTDGLSSQTSGSQPRDPLLWFSALPPQPLRQTQFIFTSAITTTIPTLLTTVAAMSALETRIWDLRAEMGISADYEDVREEEVKNVGAELAEQKEGQPNQPAQRNDCVDVKTEAQSAATEHKRGEESSSLPSPSRKQHLVSRA